MTKSSPIAFLGLPWSWSIDYDAENDCWLATIGELPDFFAAGDTPAEASLNARDALLSHITSYLNTNTPLPLPASRADAVPRTTPTPEFAEPVFA